MGKLTMMARKAFEGSEAAVELPSAEGELGPPLGHGEVCLASLQISYLLVLLAVLQQGNTPRRVSPCPVSAHM